jgi:hypothetical protein
MPCLKHKGSRLSDQWNESGIASGNSGVLRQLPPFCAERNQRKRGGWVLWEAKGGTWCPFGRFFLIDGCKSLNQKNLILFQFSHFSHLLSLQPSPSLLHSKMELKGECIDTEGFYSIFVSLPTVWFCFVGAGSHERDHGSFYLYPAPHPARFNRNWGMNRVIPIISLSIKQHSPFFILTPHAILSLRLFLSPQPRAGCCGLLPSPF